LGKWQRVNDKEERACFPSPFTLHPSPFTLHPSPFTPFSNIDSQTPSHSVAALLNAHPRRPIEKNTTNKSQGGLDEPIAVFDAAVRRGKFDYGKFDYIRKQMPEALEQSLEGLDRISKIVGAMKEFSHPSAGEKEPVDLRALVNTTVTVARNEWKYVSMLETDFEEGLPEVACLRDEIGQVLLNLVVNAAHAIADTLVPGEREKGRIIVSLKRAGQDAVDLSVSDDGAGIPDAIRTKVFDPFFTTKSVGKGTGQGLAIAYTTVVEKHKGKIFFETQAGAGTTFVVRLPIAASVAAPAATMGG
jgi:signal transduction histidine kinase